MTSETLSQKLGKSTVVKHQIQTIGQNHLQSAKPAAVQKERECWQNWEEGNKGGERKNLMQDPSKNNSDNKHAKS